MCDLRPAEVPPGAPRPPAVVGIDWQTGLVSLTLKLGFMAAGGDGKNWLILRNGTATIGLFQGMFERNIVTFNPGWDELAQTVEKFTDVREHQRQLKSLGLTLQTEADEHTTGPASFVLVDPDGNPVLVDQHV